jgi:O-antigen/teichoic acid export membrane protein
MSALTRIASGSGAAWTTMVISSVMQVALVPIYLSHWSASLYGLWLGLVSLVSLFHILDTGHQQFVGFEFLRIGGEDFARLEVVFWAALPAALGIGLLQMAVVGSFVHLGLVEWLFRVEEGAIPNGSLEDAGFVLVLHIVVFGLFGSVGGILVRLVAPLGYYPRMAWWGALYALGSAIVPAVVVISGGGIKEGGIGLAIWIVGYNFVIYNDLIRIIRRAGIAYQRPDLRFGWPQFRKSQVLVATAILAMARTTGARIVLAPLAGATQVAAFATVRTGANLALQGLSTLTNPLMPELMRLLRERDQDRVEGGFALVWFALVAAMAPAVVILQAIIEPLFSTWTRGQIVFEPTLFAVLSLGVLIFAWSQPAMAVVTGNNLLRPQLLVSIGAAAITIGGMLVLVPLLGITGAGLALLLAESFAAYCFKVIAGRWLAQNQLLWPRQSSCQAFLSVWLAAGVILAIVALPDYRFVFLALGLTSLSFNARAYWRSLPRMIRHRVIHLVYPTPRIKKA